jgi:hypothetical protein
VHRAVWIHEPGGSLSAADANESDHG